MRSIAVALAVLALAPAPALADPEFADWTSVGATESPGRADGTLLGQSVSLSGGTISHFTITDGSGVDFADAALFTPALAHSDRVDMYGTSPGSTYTLTFGAPVQDPVLHLASIASIFEFPLGTQIQKVSGTLSADQNRVIGRPPGQGGDNDGTVRLLGQYSSVSFTATQNFVGATDGIELQVGASPVPPVTPTSTPAPPTGPTAPTGPTTPASPLSPPQPPVAGKTVNSAPAAGTVSVKLPGGTEFLPLAGAASLPVGSVVDATKGKVTFQAAANGRGDVASATISAGIFAIRQAAAKGAAASAPELVLRTPPGQSRACARGPHKGAVRKLSIVAKGVFRTRAARAVVKGRNASWTVSDRCDGTLTKVKRGRVAVQAGKRAVRLRAHQQLLIKARLFGAKRRQGSR